MKNSKRIWRKKLSVICGLAAIMVLSLCVSAPVTVHAGQTVLIRRGDSGHYHSRQCQQGIYTTMTLSEAKARGITPCQTCYAKKETEKKDTEQKTPTQQPSQQPTQQPSQTSDRQPQKPVEQEKPVVLPTISLNKTELLMIKGTSQKLSVKNAVSSVSWKSSKSSVASVKKGVVKAKKAGKTTISVTANGQTRSCTVTVEAPKLSKASIELAKGTSATLQLKGCSHSVKWSSSNKKIATVKNGLVKAKAKGSAKITAKCHGKSYTCKVKVEEPAISKPSGKLYPGETMTLKFKGCTHAHKWSSLDEDIATVSSDGTVTAQNSGTATIEVSAHGKNYTCKVTVENHEISLDASDLKLEMTRDTATLHVNYKGFLSWESKAIQWSSDNASIAKVDANGLVEPVAVGTTTIRAVCGDVQASCSVRVIPKKEITLSKNYVSVYVDHTEMISVSNFTNFENTDSRTVTWQTSDSSVATISNGTITARKVGSCTITATVGKCTAECKVSVMPKSMFMNTGSLTLAVQESETLSVIYNGFLDSDKKTLSWKSSNTNVATVYNGKVTAKAKGIATITVTCGSYTANCTVTVVEKSIVIAPATVAVRVGENAAVSVSYENFRATDNKTVKWTTSNSRIATVVGGDTTATITGVAPGTATITAVCGSFRATCTVTVIEMPSVSNVYVAPDATVVKGATTVLTATIEPADASSADIVWTTSNPGKVDFGGVSTASGSLTVTVRGVEAGTANITVKVGGKTATCSVTVAEPEQPADPAPAQETQV